jgi:deoxyribodipyrimidine photo-lyase
LSPAVDWAVPEVAWCAPGERAAGTALRDFLAARIKRFDELRNDPNEPLAVSNLSPYLNFGHLSAQRVLLETMRATGIGLRGLFPAGERKGGPASFAEELIVRRELSDNYCLYNPVTYGTLAGAAKWAQDSLALHASDKREKVYSEAQFEAGATHEALWNAMQMELMHRGKLAVRFAFPAPACSISSFRPRTLTRTHNSPPAPLFQGWARMYWAKKILEWSASPAEALRLALHFNDKYSLDGRDPNGFVGCAWAVCGVHDMGWTERPVFGKIRFMNLVSTLKKFNVPRYIAAHPVRPLGGAVGGGGTSSSSSGGGGGGGGGDGAASKKRMREGE